MSVRARGGGPVLAFVLVGALLFACANSDSVVNLGSGIVGGDGGLGGGGFRPPDGSVSVEAVAQCATSECSAQYTTCPDSRFPCDVDVASDSRNCGACGVACPQGSSSWTTKCADGECRLLCNDNFANCNGKVEDGCETQTLGDAANCGSCGKTCAAGVACIGGTCGCPSSQVVCGGVCTDVTNNDASCGTCDKVCAPPVGGPAAPAHMYFGCESGQCGKLKCIQNSTSLPEVLWTDCNGDRADGCEVNLADDNANCVTCGVACAAGQQCSTILQHYPPYVTCACPGGQTICPGPIEGVANCVNIANDHENCGACGVKCSTLVEACIDGLCVLTCPKGTADCNGDRTDGYNGDGCETDTDVDPQHCGDCSTTCDAAIGQPCQGGTCATKDCIGTEAGPTR